MSEHNDGKETAPSSGAKADQSAELLVYKTDAPIRMPFFVEDAGERYQIAVLFAYSETLIKEYDMRRHERLTQADPEEAANLKGLVKESKEVEAKNWLFEQLAVGVEGMGESDEELPEDWQSYFETEDRVAMIDALLACENVELPLVPTGKRLAWKRRDSARITLLRALCDGYQITTKHIQPQKADADTLSDYKGIMQRGVIIQGAKVGNGDIYVPARIGALAGIYDRLKITAEGYRGPVPVHHKAQVVMNNLGPQVEALSKNSNATPVQ